MSQRGSVGVFLVFALVASIGAGIAAYVLIRDQRTATASTPAPARAPVPVVERPPVRPPEPEARPTEAPADALAIDPDLAGAAPLGPVFGTPGTRPLVELAPIQQVVEADRARLRRCMKRYVQDVADARAGVLRAHFTIRDGHAEEIEVIPVHDERFSGCIKHAIDIMKFPVTDTAVEVVFPLGFPR